MSQLQVPVLLTIVSTPAWAGGGSAGLMAPKRMLDLQDFAYAAADRYNGTHIDASGATLPKVVRWEAWNEPNLQTHLQPAVDGDRHEEDRGRPVLLRQDVGSVVSDDLSRHPERDLPRRARGRHGGRRPGERRGRRDGAVRQGSMRCRAGLRAARVPARSGQEACLARRVVAPSLPQPDARTPRRTGATTSTCRACPGCTPL